MHKPIVSILMTSYNREKYIAEAIESALAQTLSDFELIIVDDCSADRTVDIARQYTTDPRVRVYVNTNNLGDYPNRNRAAEYAQGKYIKYLDSDDLIYPRGLEILVETMERFPEAGYGLCSLEQDKYRMFPFQLSPKDAYHRHYLEQPLFHKAPLSSIIRREAFETVGGFTGKQHVGDFEMWHNLSARFPVVLMPHGIVWYREHGDQQMNDNLSNITVPFKYLVIEVELLQSKNNPLSSEEKEASLYRAYRRQARYILRAAKEHGPRKAAELLRMSQLSIGEVFSRAFLK